MNPASAYNNNNNNPPSSSLSLQSISPNSHDGKIMIEPASTATRRSKPTLMLPRRNFHKEIGQRYRNLDHLIQTNRHDVYYGGGGPHHVNRDPLRRSQRMPLGGTGIMRVPMPPSLSSSPYTAAIPPIRSRPWPKPQPSAIVVENEVPNFLQQQPWPLVSAIHVDRLALPPKPKFDREFRHCKICGRVYQKMECLFQHLVGHHQIKPEEFSKWHGPFVIPAKPDTSLQPRRGRPPNKNRDKPACVATQICAEIARGAQVAPNSNYKSQKLKMLENKLRYERVICSLCQKDLFQDCLREHLKRVHGLLMDNSKVANYIARRIVPILAKKEEEEEMEEEERTKIVVEEIREEKDEGKEQQGMEEEENEEKGDEEEEGGDEEPPCTTSSTSSPPATKTKWRKVHNVRLVFCGVCKKTLRRDSIREHLRTRHDIETASMKAAYKHILDEIEVEEHVKHRRYDLSNMTEVQHMYSDSQKDIFGRVFCILCNDAVFPGNLRHHLRVLHRINIHKMDTTGAVDKYAIKKARKNEQGEGEGGGMVGMMVDQLMETDADMRRAFSTKMGAKTEPADEQEQEFRQFLTADSLLLATSSTGNLRTPSLIERNGMEVKRESHSDDEG